MTTALIVGCGYLGRRAATQLMAKGYRVRGVVRSRAGADALAALGIEPIVADVLDPGSLDAVPDRVDRVLYCVGFDRAAGRPMREVYVEGLRNVLDRLAGRAGRVVYASSTGVYGQSDGGRVDENSPTVPVSPSGAVVLEAEGVVDAFRRGRGLDAVVMRFSGLYGPGRLPRRANLERGEPVPGDPDHWLNMIEIDDAAACAVAALEHPKPPSRLYVATDDRPIRRREFYGVMARHLGLPEPTFEPPEPGGREGGRDASNKRASNARIKAELGVRLAFPDIDSGVPAALAGEAP